jgi:HK97 family phage major capsid protein
MVDEVKEVLNQYGQAFEEFKKSNDEKLEKLEKGLDVPVTLTDKIECIEEKMNSLEDINQSLIQTKEANDKIQEKMDILETMAKRPNAGIDGKALDETREAFDSFCRKGQYGITDIEKKALTVSNDTTGGYLAPPEYVRELLKTVTEISPIRSIARVRNTGQRSVQVPKRTGQFAAQWVAESGTRSETTGYTVGLEEIPAHEYYALVDISEQDLEDTVFDLEAEMQSEFATQFAKAEGTAFVSGDSVGKPEGILTNSSVSSVNSGNGTALTADGLITLVHSIKSEYARSGTFVFNRSTLSAIRKLKDTAGQYVFQAGMMLTGGVTNTILGYPYVEATDMPDVGSSAKPIVFGDFARAYLIIDRVQMSVLRDEMTQATTGNVRYIARRRVGGQVVQAEAIVKQNISA